LLGQRPCLIDLLQLVRAENIVEQRRIASGSLKVARIIFGRDQVAREEVGGKRLSVSAG
jgi:hypothetical protein